MKKTHKNPKKSPTLTVSRAKTVPKVGGSEKNTNNTYIPKTTDKKRNNSLRSYRRKIRF